MEQVLAADVADLGDDELGQRTLPGFPCLDVVELGALVDRGPFFPERLVGSHVLVHGASLATGGRGGEASFGGAGVISGNRGTEATRATVYG
jgi:hypothetical protein